jgi:S-adenosylmethionine:tRNA ribosyltransferase-isomerase
VHLSDFDYDLPDDLIAQHPLPERDASRMLVVNRADGTIRDSEFILLPNYLRAGDCLVLNNTRVFPARLIGSRVPTGGTVELLLLNEIEPTVWRVLARPARRLKPGTRVSFGNSRLTAVVTTTNDDGTRVVEFDSGNRLHEIIGQIGQTPLPPYIKRDDSAEDDRERYQTIYARESGAIAAPTAGLHFTPRVLERLKNAGVAVAEITLHVGYGTFEPVRVDDVSRHRVMPEAFVIDANTAECINGSRTSGGRVIAVGTTTTRALESASVNGMISATAGMANLTVTPGYEFKAVDALLTNFHLPKSSLLLLVSAFAGRELILEAYRHAVRERYRFYSYGDCMLIV